MIKETVCIRNKKTNLTVANSKVSAVLRSDIQKTGVRLYEDGCLGIAGAIGAYNEDELIKSAEHMLKFKLPYAGSPTEGARRSLDLSGVLGVTEAEFVETSEEVLAVMRKEYPMFMFTHKLCLIENEESLVNDAGTELKQKDRYIECGLIVKHRDSANLFDGFNFVVARELNADVMLKEFTWICDAYGEKADFSEKAEKIPVVLLGHDALIKKFLTDLEGNTFGSGASLFSGKTGEKLFDDKFSLIVDRNTGETYSRFFDGEGVTLEQDRFTLVDKGVLRSPYTTKRIAKKYDLPETGSASMIYDSAPGVNYEGIAVARSDKTLSELLGGRKAVFAVIAGGGDFTPQGEFASPIQVAYLYDGVNCFGRLPQLSMSSHVNDMFGKDFIGASADGSYPGCPFSYLVLDMNVRKIDEWI